MQHHRDVGKVSLLHPPSHRANLHHASHRAGWLHLTAGHKGTIYVWWAIVQSLLPVVTGGIADRYGYKKMFFLSVTMNIAGDLTMAYSHSYYGFFVGIVILAIYARLAMHWSVMNA